MNRIILSKLKNLKGKKIAVIGDIILDKYVYGEVNRISPEAPVPVVKANNIEYKLGAAANVAKNIAYMGGVPILIGLSGTDQVTSILFPLLNKNSISSQYLIEKKDFKTNIKERVIALNQQMLRIDYDPDNNKYKIFPHIKKVLEKNHIDAIIIEDYNKGLIKKSTMENIVRFANKKNIPTISDPHPTRNISFYKGSFCLTPNLNEAEQLLRIKKSLPYEELVKRTQKACGNKMVLLTLGKHGMILYDKKVHFIPTKVKKVYDVTGAGDTVVALFTLGLASGLSSIESAILANYGASYVVTQLGAAAPTPDIIKEIISNN